jgi:hypothetical protein
VRGLVVNSADATLAAGYLTDAANDDQTLDVTGRSRGERVGDVRGVFAVEGADETLSRADDVLWRSCRSRPA